MATYTFDTLKAALKSWNQDQFSDYETDLPDILAKAELKCLRDLDLELFDSTDTSKATVGAVQTLDLPAGTVRLRQLWLDGAFVQPRSESYVYQYSLDNGFEDQPLYWCQSSETTVLLAPVPDATYPARMRVMIRPDGLSDTVPTTWLSTHAGDLLFWACLSVTEHWTKAVEDAAATEARYQQTLQQTQLELAPLMARDYR